MWDFTAGVADPSGDQGWKRCCDSSFESWLCWNQSAEEMRNASESCRHALYQPVSTAAWGFQMLTSKWNIFFCPKKMFFLQKKPLCSYKSSAKKYSQLFLLADAETHSVLNRPDLEVISSVSYSRATLIKQAVSLLPSAAQCQHHSTWSLCYQSWGKDGANYWDRFHREWFTQGSAYWTPCSSS